MRILVTGAGGMLGRDACDEIRKRGHEVISTGRKHGLTYLDVTDLSQTRDVFQQYRPDFVFHCAAWTDVDEAERDMLGAYRGNTLACWNVAAVCQEIGAWLLDISTDFVFDGRKGQPYTEFDMPNPLGVYGASKAAGERLVREIMPSRGIIVRTSWLYGAHGRSFPATILRLAQKLPEVPVVMDEIGSPTNTQTLARKLVDLAESPMAGTYHVCDAGSCSRYEMAKATLEFAGLTTPILPISRVEYGERFKPAAERPAYSVLRRLSMEMRNIDDVPEWRESLADFVKMRTWVQ